MREQVPAGPSAPRDDDRARRPFIPALGRAWLLPLYDPLLAWVMRENAMKRALLLQADLSAGHRVLDLGCGTGTLVVLAHRARPGIQVVGLDVDPDVLARARSKIERAGVDAPLVLGSARELPFPDGTFDRVLSSLVFHHLAVGDKRRALEEIRRVVRPGGSFHMVDFGPPASRLVAPVTRLIGHFEEADDNLAGRLPSMMRAAGLVDATEEGHLLTPLGSLTYYRAARESV